MSKSLKTFRFLDFPVYAVAKGLYKEMVVLTKSFPRQHWELGDQLRRCALSVCLNIAEGSAKYSDKEFKRFIETALGSINEAVSCLDIALDNRLITQVSFQQNVASADSIARQLGGLAKRLRHTSS